VNSEVIDLILVNDRVLGLWTSLTIRGSWPAERIAVSNTQLCFSGLGGLTDDRVDFCDQQAAAVRIRSAGN
jgi:hypothetical protein